MNQKLVDRMLAKGARRGRDPREPVIVCFEPAKGFVEGNIAIVSRAAEIMMDHGATPEERAVMGERSGGACKRALTWCIDANSPPPTPTRTPTDALRSSHHHAYSG